MDTTLAVAIAACLVAASALLMTLVLARRLRRLQSGQKAVLGGASHDMVDFAVSLIVMLGLMAYCCIRVHPGRGFRFCGQQTNTSQWSCIHRPARCFPLP